MPDYDLSLIAAAYADAAIGSVNARTKRDENRKRGESYGYLRSLDLLVGMQQACNWIEAIFDDPRRQGYRERCTPRHFWNVPV